MSPRGAAAGRERVLRGGTATNGRGIATLEALFEDSIPVFAQDPVTALPDAYKLELALLPRLPKEGAPLTLIGEMKRCV